MENSKNFYPVLSLGVTKRLLKRTLVLLLCSTALCVATLRFVTLVEAAKIIPTTTPAAIRSSKVIAPAPTPPTVTPAAASPATCVPFGSVPTPTDLSLTTPGLQQLIDAPQTYTIYGNSTTEIARQLQRCAATGDGGSFSGATSYWLGNRYNYQVTPAALCELSDITVGVHISQVLPSWKGSGNASLGTKWETFERNLILHENGHTVIDIAEAQALLNDLQSLPAMPCDQIAVAANTITNNHIAALNAANNSYDAETGHGTRQGATW